MSFRVSLAALAVISLVLAACGGSTPRRVPEQVRCPGVVNYTDKQLTDIQHAIDRLPKDDPLRGAMQDYEQLRDDARYCANLQKEQRRR